MKFLLPVLALLAGCAPRHELASPEFPVDPAFLEREDHADKAWDAGNVAAALAELNALARDFPSEFHGAHLRGYIRFVNHDWSGALSDFEKRGDNYGWGLSPFFEWLLLSRAGLPIRAHDVLASEVWGPITGYISYDPWRLTDYLLDRCDEAKLLTRPAEQVTDVYHFFIAEKLLLQGHRDDAIRQFEAALLGPTNEFSSRIRACATSELKRLSR